MQVSYPRIFRYIAPAAQIRFQTMEVLCAEWISGKWARRVCSMCAVWCTYDFPMINVDKLVLQCNCYFGSALCIRHVCMHYMYECAYIYIYIYDICIYVCVYMYMYVCIYIYIYVYILCMSISCYMLIHTGIHSHWYTRYTHLCPADIHIFVHTDIHGIHIFVRQRETYAYERHGSMGTTQLLSCLMETVRDITTRSMPVQRVGNTG